MNQYVLIDVLATVFVQVLDIGFADQAALIGVEGGAVGCYSHFF